MDVFASTLNNAAKGIPDQKTDVFSNTLNQAARVSTATLTLHPKVRILGLDPGAGKMGWSILDYYPTLGHYVVVATGCWDGAKLIKHHKALVANFGKHYTILMAIYDSTCKLIAEWSPTVIGSEGAFHHKFPQVHASLTLVIHSVRRAAHDILNQDVEIVAPMETKKMIAKNHMANKDQMKAAVLHKTDITFADGIDYQNLTEHEYDAIGHGYTAYQKIIQSDKK